MKKNNINEAIKCLTEGKVIAYPTEAVYGLGCDPFNTDAITYLLQLKHRAIEKGFILVADDWQQVENLVEPIEPKLLSRIFTTWPGPATWVFPAADNVPFWIRGKHATIAIRISDHPVVKALTKEFGPIISTSANREGLPPTRDYRTTVMTFGELVATVVEGQVGGDKNPTEIRDAITGEVLRSG